MLRQVISHQSNNLWYLKFGLLHHENKNLPDTDRKSSIDVISSTASVRTRTCFSHCSLNKSILSWATLLLGLAARARAALITCNQPITAIKAPLHQFHTPPSLQPQCRDCPCKLFHSWSSLTQQDTLKTRWFHSFIFQQSLAHVRAHEGQESSDYMKSNSDNEAKALIGWYLRAKAFQLRCCHSN